MRPKVAVTILIKIINVKPARFLLRLDLSVPIRLMSCILSFH